MGGILFVFSFNSDMKCKYVSFFFYQACKYVCVVLIHILFALSKRKGCTSFQAHEILILF